MSGPARQPVVTIFAKVVTTDDFTLFDAGVCDGSRRWKRSDNLQRKGCTQRSFAVQPGGIRTSSMNSLAKTCRNFVIAANALAFAATGAIAAPMAARPQAPEIVAPVQADCYSIGQQIADQHGGTLAGANPSNQGGRPVCVVVVLIPGKDGERPRRERFVVPAN